MQVYYFYNSKLPIPDKAEMFEVLSTRKLEVDYYADKINKSKYKNFQLITLSKNNLKIVEEQIIQGVCLHRQLFIPCCLDQKFMLF